MMSSLRTPDGRTLSYEVRGDGEPLVCHPGGPGFSSAYLGDLGGLDRFRAIVAIDPRGTRRSDPPASRDAYQLDHYVGDLDSLREHLQTHEMDLLGHSHGALVAVKYAAQYPERIRRLVLVAVATRFSHDQVEAMQAGMQRRSGEPWFEDAVAAIKEEQDGLFRDDAELGRIVARELPFYFADYGEREQAFVQMAFEQPMHAPALRHFNANEFLSFDLRPALSRVTAPTLVVAGQHDFILGPDVCREVASGIADSRLEVLPNVGHMPWVENPSGFASVVEAFLDE